MATKFLNFIERAVSPEHVAPPEQRGYQPVYRPDESNYCPGCGRSHWYVGRVSAECAFCSTAISLVDAGNSGQGALIHRINRTSRSVSEGRYDS